MFSAAASSLIFPFDLILVLSVSEVCNVNKMTTSNLATVIGPNVLKPVDDGSDRIVLDIGNQVGVFLRDVSRTWLYMNPLEKITILALKTNSGERG